MNTSKISVVLGAVLVMFSLSVSAQVTTNFTKYYHPVLDIPTSKVLLTTDEVLTAAADTLYVTNVLNASNVYSGVLTTQVGYEIWSELAFPPARAGGQVLQYNNTEGTAYSIFHTISDGIISMLNNDMPFYVYTLTTNAAGPAAKFSGIWNTANSPSFFVIGVTNTASGATAKLFDVQTNGTSALYVDRGGKLYSSGIQMNDAFGATAGDARGAGAVDLQSMRDAATKVASGAYSAIVAGSEHTASVTNAAVLGGYGNAAGGLGNNAIVGGHGNTISGATTTNAVILGGYGNMVRKEGSAVIGGTVASLVSGIGSLAVGQGGHTVSGTSSFAFGYGNTVSGSSSAAFGYASEATGSHSFVVGRYASGNKYGQSSHAAGYFAAVGDAQFSRLVARRSVTAEGTANSGVTNTWVELGLAGDAASLTRAVLPANTTWMFEINISARGTAAGTGGEISAGYKITGVIERNGENNTALVGSVTVTTIAEDDADWDVRATANDTNEALMIEFYCDENPARVVAVVHLTECGG